MLYVIDGRIPTFRAMVRIPLGRHAISMLFGGSVFRNPTRVSSWIRVYTHLFAHDKLGNDSRMESRSLTALGNDPQKKIRRVVIAGQLCMNSIKWPRSTRTFHGAILTLATHLRLTCYSRLLPQVLDRLHMAILFGPHQGCLPGSAPQPHIPSSPLYCLKNA